MDQVSYRNKINKDNYTLTICKQQLFTLQCGIYFRKNSYLEYAVNQKIEAVITNGLIDLWASRYIDANIMPRKTGPKTLNIEQLRGGFEIMFIGLSVGLIVFLLEALAGLLNFWLLKKFFEFVT